MDKKQKALTEITAKLEEAKAIFAECKQIADDANVPFNFIVHPDALTDLTYYPIGYAMGSKKDDDFYKRFAGKWLSSTDECTM